MKGKKQVNKPEPVKVFVVLNTELLEELERIAKRMGRDRSDTIRSMLYFGIEVYKDFEKVGVVRLSEVLVRSEMAIKEKFGFPDSSQMVSE